MNREPTDSEWAVAGGLTWVIFAGLVVLVLVAIIRLDTGAPL